MLSDTRLQKEMGAGYDVVAANIVADVIIAVGLHSAAPFRIICRDS